MKPEMLKSQFAALEEPQNALIVEISMPLEEMLVYVAEKRFGLAGGFRGESGSPSRKDIGTM
jgi:hypothetical protein